MHIHVSSPLEFPKLEAKCLVLEAKMITLFVILNVCRENNTFLNVYLFLRERDKAQAGERQRERETESKAGSRL